MVVPQKLSTVLWVMILWRSLLSVGDEVMTRIWNVATAAGRRPTPPPPPPDPLEAEIQHSIDNDPGWWAREPLTRSEPDDARLDRRVRPDRQLGIGVPAGAPALGRRARIEQQEPVAVLAHGLMACGRSRRRARPGSGRAAARGDRGPGPESCTSAIGTPPISTVCSSGHRATTSQPSQLPATPSSGASAPSSSSSATSVTSPVCRMRSASAQAASKADGSGLRRRGPRCVSPVTTT